MTSDEIQLACVEHEIGKLPTPDQEFIKAEAAYLEAKMQTDPRYPMVIALVGSRLAAQPS